MKQHQMDKKMEHDKETGIVLVVYRDVGLPKNRGTFWEVPIRGIGMSCELYWGTICVDSNLFRWHLGVTRRAWA